VATLRRKERDRERRETNVMSQKPNEELAKGLEHRKSVLESDELDEEENQEHSADAARKEDKTMLGAKALKESDEKGEKFGASGFQMAKKMAKGQSQDDLGDEKDWEDGPNENN